MYAPAVMLLASFVLDVIVAVELAIWGLGKIIKGMASGIVLIPGVDLTSSQWVMNQINFLLTSRGSEKRGHKKQLKILHLIHCFYLMNRKTMALNPKVVCH